MKTTGELIAQLRKDLGLTMEAFAARLDISKSMVHAWEHDENEPNLESVRHISRTFDLPVTALIGDLKKNGRAA